MKGCGWCIWAVCKVGEVVEDEVVDLMIGGGLIVWFWVGVDEFEGDDDNGVDIFEFWSFEGLKYEVREGSDLTDWICCSLSSSNAAAFAKMFISNALLLLVLLFDWIEVVEWLVVIGVLEEFKGVNWKLDFGGELGKDAVWAMMSFLISTSFSLTSFSFLVFAGWFFFIL